MSIRTQTPRIPAAPQGDLSGRSVIVIGGEPTARDVLEDLGAGKQR